MQLTHGQVSEYIEKLTDEIAQKAWTLIEEVESYGGMTKPLKQVFPRCASKKLLAQKQAELTAVRMQLSGVNLFQTDDEQNIEILDIDNAEVRNKQINRLMQIRAVRDNRAVKDILNQLTKATKNNDNNLLTLSVWSGQKTRH